MKVSSGRQKKPCECGATTHQRKSHQMCPLSPLNKGKLGNRELKEGNGIMSDFEGIFLDDSLSESEVELVFPSSDEEDGGLAHICTSGNSSQSILSLESLQFGWVLQA